MDVRVEESTARLMRLKNTDFKNEFHGRNSNFQLEFTRKPKELFAPYSKYPPYTDSGSFQSRKYFTRPEFVIQNVQNGGTQVRPQFIPRIRKMQILN
jgi:hypothetical protein